MPSIVTNGLSLHLDASNPQSYTGLDNYWYDLSGNNFDYTISNTSFNSANGGSIVFTYGSNSEGISPNFDLTFQNTGFTYEVWVNPTSNGGNILSERNGVGWYVALMEILNGGEVRVGFWNGGTAYISAGNVTPNTWNQIVMTYDGTTLNAYLNGAPTTNLVTTKQYPKDYGGGYYIPIADFEPTNFGNGNDFDGKIKNVKFYNRALTNEEVLQNYTALTTLDVKKKSITFQRSSKIKSIPPTAYKYYKWHITDIRQNLDSFTQASEFTFLVDGSGIDMTVASVSLLNAHTSPGGEGVGNLIDDNIYTKFLDLSWESGGSEIVFEFPTAQIFEGYKWATANDSEWRDPKSWTLYGSNNNTNWDILDVVSGFTSTMNRWTFNEPFLYTTGFDASLIPSKVTFTANIIPKTNDGTTALRAGSSAYQIKTDFPSSTDGLYWIKNPNINNGEPFQIYADMTTDGGGWTLLLLNNNNGWTYQNALLRNQLTPPSSPNDRPPQQQGTNGSDNYSIVGWADYIKKSESGFQYMIDASSRGRWGGIWTANGTYSFVNTDNSQTDITLNTKFDNWNYTDTGVEQHMPWYSNNCGVLTTSNSPYDQWWGSLISQCGWAPAPWMSNENANPGIIWYWVR